MNIKEFVEGMTAPQVAQVIKDNFNEVDKDKANKTDLNKSISDLSSVVEANKTDLTKKIDNNKEDTDEKLSELESKWAKDVKTLSLTSMGTHIISASAIVYDVVQWVGLYNIRVENGLPIISVMIKMRNGSQNGYSRNLSLIPHDSYTNETYDIEVGGKRVVLHLCYRTDLIKTASGQTPIHQIANVSFVRNIYVNYESAELSLLYNASIPYSWIHLIYKKANIDNAAIIGYRNDSAGGFVLKMNINGADFTVSKPIQKGLVTVDFGYLEITINVDVMVGNFGMYIPLNVNAITYKSVGVIVNNDLMSQGYDKLPAGTLVNWKLNGDAYGQKGAIYQIPLPKTQKVHIYAEYVFDKPMPVGNYQAICNVCGVRVQYSNLGKRVEKDGSIYSLVNASLNEASKQMGYGQFKSFDGNIAFNFRYIGSDVNAKLEVSNGLITMTENNNQIASVAYSNEESVYSLVNKLSGFPNLIVEGVEVVEHNCGDLLFDGIIIPLRNTYERDDNSTYVDNPTYYVKYAQNNETHSLEILIDRIEGKIYVAYDGYTLTNQIIDDDGILRLVGGVVTFKNFHMADDCEDAEIVTHKIEGYSEEYQLISNKNPKLLVWEGHGVDFCMDEDAPLSDDMAASTDRLMRVFDKLKEKGYIPVTWQDVISWKLNNKPLPKRCYTLMMDDFRVDNYVNPYKRIPFEKYDVKPGLAIIEDYDRDETIEVDGDTFTKGECTDICMRAGWHLASHAQHKRLGSQDISTLPTLWIECVKKCNAVGIYSDIIIYPYGSWRNIVPSLEASPFKIGVTIVTAKYNCQALNNFYFSRVEIGVRKTIDKVLSYIL